LHSRVDAVDRLQHGDGREVIAVRRRPKELAERSDEREELIKNDWEKKEPEKCQRPVLLSINAREAVRR
jgi:hypothetical protein